MIKVGSQFSGVGAFEQSLKRLGIEYNDINTALAENIKLNLIEEHKIERWYGDLSLLLEFIQSNKEK